MRALLAILSIVCVALLLIGCGAEKPEETAPIEVETPAEKPAPTVTPPPEAQPPAPTPGPDGWVTLPSGLKYKDKKVGTGAAVASGQRVTVHYKGWLDNGKVFDTSKKPGREPFQFTVGNGEVIKGWDEGVAGMKVGGIRELNVPPDLGYADQDMGEIPPNSTLHFEVELLSIAGGGEGRNRDPNPRPLELKHDHRFDRSALGH